MVTTDTTLFGVILKTTRERLYLSVSQLARRALLTPHGVRAIEQGRRGASYDVAAGLADSLGVPLDWFRDVQLDPRDGQAALALARLEAIQEWKEGARPFWTKSDQVEPPAVEPNPVVADQVEPPAVEPAVSTSVELPSSTVSSSAPIPSGPELTEAEKPTELAMEPAPTKKPRARKPKAGRSTSKPTHGLPKDWPFTKGKKTVRHKGDRVSSTYTPAKCKKPKGNN